MGRAARRAQQRAARRQRGQAAGSAQRARAPVSTSVSSPDTGRRGSFLKPRWATDIISELRKVTWPTRQETAHLTLVVVVVSILFGIVLGSADLFFSWVLEKALLQ